MPRSSGASVLHQPAAVRRRERGDTSDNPSAGGDWEERISPIEEAILSSKSDSVNIRVSARPGNYQIFADIYDPSGKVATVTLPVRVE
jgi:hypothetical protein